MSQRPDQESPPAPRFDAPIRVTYRDGIAQVTDARAEEVKPDSATLPASPVSLPDSRPDGSSLSEALHKLKLLDDAEGAQAAGLAERLNASELTYAPLDEESASDLPPWEHWRVFSRMKDDPETQELPPVEGGTLDDAA